MTNITLSALKQGASEITVASTADPTVTARIPAIISPADQATPVKLTDGMWSLPGDGGDGLTLAKAYRPGRWHGDQLTDEYLASGKASMDEWLDWVAEHFNAGTPLPVDNTGACSALTAYAPDAKGWVAGRNMDWGVGVAALLYRLDPEHGHASLNVAAVPSNAKNGIPTAGELAAAAACAPWLAMDGINDAGLMAACLQVGRYTAPGSGTRIAQMGLVRILLDKAGSVDEAVTLAQSLDPAEFGGSWSALGGLHWIVADKSGDAAVLEMDAGRQVTRRKTSDACMCVTNTMVHDGACKKRQQVGEAHGGRGVRRRHHVHRTDDLAHALHPEHHQPQPAMDHRLQPGYRQSRHHHSRRHKPRPNHHPQLILHGACRRMAHTARRRFVLQPRSTPLILPLADSFLLSLPRGEPFFNRQGETHFCKGD